MESIEQTTETEQNHQTEHTQETQQNHQPDPGRQTSQTNQSDRQDREANHPQASSGAQGALPGGRRPAGAPWL